MKPKSDTTRRTAKTADEWAHRALALLLFAVFALVAAQFWRPLNLPGGPGWSDAVLLLLASSSSIAALARHLPSQNVLSAVVCIGLAGGAVDWLGAETGIPFGGFSFGDMGPRLFGVLPWAMPLIWVVAILNSRGVARLVLRPWRKTKTYGFWLIGVTATLTALFALALDPLATHVRHYWWWVPAKLPLTWQGASLVDFLGWAVVTPLILVFVTPMLINKHPTHRRPPDFHPLGVWLGAILLFGIGAAVNGLWTAAGLDGIIFAAIAAFAIRGSRW